MKYLASVATGLVFVLAASPAALARPHVDASGQLIRDEHSCGTTRTPAPIEQAPRPYAAPGTPRTIYLNRFGGTYNVAGGATNSATNATSSIASGDGAAHANAVIPPLEVSFNWPYIVDCIKKQYKPYNVIITETEPTSGAYVEAVVGGNGRSMGWSAGSGILGVAAADNFCGVTERGIAFSYSTNHLGVAKANDELCTTIAHEVGHLLALEHEIAGPDTMSYVPFVSSGGKSFTTANSHCGTDTQNQRNCSCTPTAAGQLTSSATRLTQYVGLRPMETVPPTLEVNAPSNNKTVRPTFSVLAIATDETAMDQVAARIDGAIAGASTVPEGTAYTISLANVAEGPHMLEVEASDLAGNVTKRQLAITVAKGKTGETCEVAGDCQGNLCALLSDGTTFCSQTCGPDNACPDDFACDSSTGQSFCVPTEGGGCDAGGGRSAFALLFVLLLVVGRSKARRPT